MRYTLLAAVALVASALANSILQSSASLYVAFEPRMFGRDLPVLISVLAAVGLAGAWLDAPTQSPWRRACMRWLLLAMLLVAVFETLRRTLATSFSLGGGLKVALVLGCLGLAALAVWKLPEASLRRMASAIALALTLSYALHPGMSSYLVQAIASTSARSTNAAEPWTGRKTVVLVLDEWDMEVALRQEQFATPQLSQLLQHSFFAENALPGGSNTLTSIPSMLIGRRFGKIDLGGPGWLTNAAGDRFDALSPSLFNDLTSRRLPFAVVGFYHDYCRLAPAARDCLAVPVSFFGGWAQELSRAWRVRHDFDSADTDFVRQWSHTLERLRSVGLRAVEDPGNAVVWLHLNTPHPPVSSGDAPRSLEADYRANMAQLPRLLSDIASRLASGDSALIATSDHWLREHELWAGNYVSQLGPGRGQAGKTGDQRVPFLVWFSRSNGPAVRLTSPVSTVSIRELALALVERRLNSPAEVGDFLRARRDDAKALSTGSGGASVH